MDIKGTTVVHLAQYAAPYLGNFVKSLMCLERRMQGPAAEWSMFFRLRQVTVRGLRTLHQNTR